MGDYIKVELTEEQYDKISRIGITKLEVTSIGCKMIVGGGCSDFEMTLMDKDRFNQPSSDSEALDMIDTTSKQVESLANNSELPNSSKFDRAAGGPIKVSPPEWNGKGLPPVGAECEKIFDGKSQIVTPLYYDDHKSGMVMFYYRDSGNSVGSDYDWCLVENCIFRKPETPQQREERERLEAAYDLYLKVQERDEGPGFAASFKQFQDGMMSTCRKDYLSIVDITGYRKESK